MPYAMKFRTASTVIFCSLWIFGAAKERREERVAGDAPAILKAGIILTNGTNLPYDYSGLAPALEAAYEKALNDYNVLFQPVLSLYVGGCNESGAVGATFMAINQTVDVIIGPACTADMMSSLELQTYFLVPSVTGAGDLVDSTAKFPYITRCSYNTYTQWIFFTRLCIKYAWSNVAVIYDAGNNARSVNARSLMTNLRDHQIRSFEMSFSAAKLTDGNMAMLLRNASYNARVVVLLMDGLLLRKFLLAAQRLGQTDGDYVFLTLDLFQSDVLANNGWKQNDNQNALALAAYQSLLVLTLRDTRNEPRYKEFVEHVENVANGRKVLLNYILFLQNLYLKYFYDSILLYALSVREMIDEDKPYWEKRYLLKLSQKFWNRTFPGATGIVYINPLGDRNDDHAMYDMTADGMFYLAAEFYGYKDIWIQNYTFDQVSPFLWGNPSNTPPLNEPPCGYLGNDPKCNRRLQNMGIGLGVTASLLLIALVSLITLRRIHQRNRELNQLDLLASWQDISDPQFLQLNKRLNTRGSHRRHSLSVYAYINNLGDHARPDSNNTNFALDLDALAGDIGYLSKRTITAKFRGAQVVVRVCEVVQLPISRSILKEVKDVRKLLHENLLPMREFCLGPERATILYDFCSRGSLRELVCYSDFQMDDIFKTSLIRDVVEGLMMIQKSTIKCHGRLTSCCCYVDSHFTCKLADYGLPSFFVRTVPDEHDERFCESLLWTAPELLPHHATFGEGTQEGDVYSLAIIMCEVAMEQPPFSTKAMPASMILAKLQKRKTALGLFRPRLDASKMSPEMMILVKQCWSQDPMERPRLAQVRRSLLTIGREALSGSGSLVDKLIEKTEHYTKDLENIVEEKSLQVVAEMQKSEKLLYDILPRSVADQLIRGQHVAPETFDSVTVQYNDIVSFTALSSESTPTEIVNLLNDLFTVFDNCIQLFDTHKVETIGDCYVVASGVPIRNGNRHATEVCRLSLMLLNKIKVFKIAHRPEQPLQLRLGVHTGPCAAGVVGLVMPRYCLFGETIRITNKMEATSKAMKIQISESCKDLLLPVASFALESREEAVQINDEKSIRTFWLLNENTIF
ncbi:atrial natriuretic peptide receptor 1-like [Paramacrobiotus metropolitanus]|uniref:atrial natriuretic peptide receptor 1-like n=1 Tax=Paramacrobiotus metropolitanus TaxID=2943436 RepID=UPI0024461A4B|nr:atrial natriuretic peptide receptor 1-like [Paramacrobiotus metropolitanus]